MSIITLDMLTPDEVEKTKEREHELKKEFDRIGMHQTAILLIQLGFCTAPASVSYHGNYIGGLFDHSKAVTEALVDMTNDLQLEWNNDSDPHKVGWLHDICKIDSYDYKQMVYEKGKAPYRGDGFSYAKPEFPYGGHAIKSLALCQKFGIPLSDEELFCIRYHMGAYEKDDWEGYDAAIKKYPNVLWTHTADMVASKLMGV